MKRRFALLLLLLPFFALTSCSDGNSEAPRDKEAHPLDWLRTHPSDALAVAGFANCIGCHGTDLRGNGDAVSCFSCHVFNTSPPFTKHPDEWTDPYIDHRGFAAANGFDSCTKCHGADLHGSLAAPSCFSASFEGRSCHAEGPGQAPHPLDRSFLLPQNHGPAAKGLTPTFPNGIADCQPCHAQPGVTVNPRFNVGINSANGTGCEGAGCHDVNYAHPTAWAGPNATFHYSVNQNIIQPSCTLCHGASLDGVGGVGVSCLDCHASTTTFTLNCTACHGNPPDGSADVATTTGVAHGIVAAVPQHDTCVVCHGMKESDTGGSFSATANYLLFDKATNTIGDHWNGSINMNDSTSYNEANFGCDFACHANDVGHQLSDSGLPVELKSYGFGGAVPHPVDQSFLDPLNHGPAAKGLTAAFPNGMVDCQPCHAQAGVNPRFNVGIIRVGGIGCEACHNVQTAHPSVGVNDNVHWYDGPYTHSNVTSFATICSLCHGANLGGVADGGVGPACTDCHVADPVANPSGCVSCHNVPPNGGGGLAGNVRPNRQGQHNRGGHTSLINPDPIQTCSRCHNGAGFGTAAHFDTLPPADVNFLHPDATDTISAISDATNTTCNGGCHIVSGGNDFVFQHNDRTWY